MFFCLLEVVAAGIELFLPALPVNYDAGFDQASRLFVVSKHDSQIRVTNPLQLQNFNSQRFTARKPADTFRIIALGGSSVLRLNSEFRVLETQLAIQCGARCKRVEVINAGGSSYGSHRLVIVLRECLQYEPDLILLYSAHNEMIEVEQYQLISRASVVMERRLSRLALVRVARDCIGRIAINRLRRQNRRILENPTPDVWRAWSYPFTMKDVERRMQAYRRNLEEIVLLCRAAKTPLIVGTVPSNLFRPWISAEASKSYQQAQRLFDAGQAEQGVQLAQSILQRTPDRKQSSVVENDIIRAVTEVHDVPLADIEASVIAHEPRGIPGETLFSDHCHLNAHGMAIWRKVFVNQILKMFFDRGRTSSNLNADSAQSNNQTI